MTEIEKLLHWQLENTDADRQKDAADCLKICAALKELFNGRLRTPYLKILLSFSFIGNTAEDRHRIYKPTQVGRLFLRGYEAERQIVGEDSYVIPWIDVSDRLPDDNQEVVVLFRKDGKLNVGKHVFSSTRSIINGKWVHGNNFVIAWVSFLDVIEYALTHD